MTVTTAPLSPSRTWTGTRLLGSILLSIVWFGVYVLSIGPALAIVFATESGEALAITFYDPVVWLYENTILQTPLQWYSRLWGWR